jgi:signal transduction histidine kinase
MPDAPLDGGPVGGWRAKATRWVRFERPILRVQLTLLYSGLFLALLAAVLLVSGGLYRQSTQAAPGTPVGVGPGGGDTPGGHHFDSGPALIALAGLAVAVLLAWWLAGRFLRPLREMTAAAQEISATNLHRRLALRGPSDELTELGRTLDDLFGRLDAAFASQRHFVLNASHELRTPLAGQRSLLQVALADPDASADDLRAACAEALQLGDQQERLIEALLTLAASEGGIQHPDPIDLALIVDAVSSGVQGAAARAGVRLETSLASAPATGDAALVERLVANLVDNALRHNRDGGWVRISTGQPGGLSTLTVSNSGPALAAGQFDRLLLSLADGGRARAGRRDGHGLGLTIVGAVARAHGAQVVARARDEGGLEVQVTFARS